MKKLIILILILIIPKMVFSDNGITIPYDDFKHMYGETIRRQVQDQKEKEPFVYTIDSAFYKLSVKPEGAVCEADISGRVLTGKPEPFPLFKTRTIINTITQVTGGSLICNHEESGGIDFFSSGTERFQITLSLFIPAGEDNQSGFIAMDIPGALKNTLSLDTDKRMTVTDIPGVKDQAGIYHFSPRSALKLRFTDKKQTPADTKKQSETLSKRYQSVDTPPLVLDSISCFTSFEENGNNLSMIVMTLPPEAGELLKIKAIPQASIWSCKVNRKKVKVYSSGEKEMFWIIPLEKGKPSLLELAVLCKGSKMGLQGRLELSLPAMDLPARNVMFTVGLPQRVELMSFEGPVSPDTPTHVETPEEFIGTPYYFSRSFYKGEGIQLAVIYKEPTN